MRAGEIFNKAMRLKHIIYSRLLKRNKTYIAFERSDVKCLLLASDTPVVYYILSLLVFPMK